jgi:hypothetical protein
MLVIFCIKLSAVFLSCFLLQGMVFDLEKNCSLHVDLAKSNSRSKRLRSGTQLPFSFYIFPSYVLSVLCGSLLMLTHFCCCYSDDTSPYSPEKRNRKPRGFPDSGMTQVAFWAEWHERKPSVFSHHEDLGAYSLWEVHYNHLNNISCSKSTVLPPSNHN